MGISRSLEGSDDEGAGAGHVSVVTGAESTPEQLVVCLEQEEY